MINWKIYYYLGEGIVEIEVEILSNEVRNDLGICGCGERLLIF